jgi:hypothetical protein
MITLAGEDLNAFLSRRNVNKLSIFAKKVESSFTLEFKDFLYKVIDFRFFKGFSIRIGKEFPNIISRFGKKTPK